MVSVRRILCSCLGVAAVIFIAAPTWATISRDVVVMDYMGALGGTIQITADGGSHWEFVYAGPYRFNVYDAALSGGNVVKSGSSTELVLMFCDSASYNLATSYPYVELSGSDVLSGYGRLYDHASSPTAIDTYKRMSWAFQYAMSPSSTTNEKKAAQVYIWELWSDVVTGDPFNLAAGQFQVASINLSAITTEINYILSHVDTSVIASLNVPVTKLSGITDALYSDILSGFTTYFKNSESSQEFLVDPFVHAPEPGTLLMLGGGLLGLLAHRRLRRLKSSSD